MILITTTNNNNNNINYIKNEKSKYITKII